MKEIFHDIADISHELTILKDHNITRIISLKIKKTFYINYRFVGIFPKLQLKKLKNCITPK